MAACSNSPPPPPDTFVNAALGGGSACTDYMSPKIWVKIGDALMGKPNTVQDGGSDRSATVSVNCTVHPQGNGFDIELLASENGPNGGSITISSTQGAGAVTAMTSSSGISASFVGQGGIVYREQAGSMVNGQTDSGCTITYQYDPTGSVGGLAGDQPVPTMPPIAAGRIWGHIKCPNAVSENNSKLICNAEADFIFEQCNQ